MIPKNRAPTHPGEILQEEFLKPLGISQTELAMKLKIPIQRINTIIRGKRGVTADTAILLGRALETSPEFWMNLQSGFDLWEAEKHLPNVVALRPATVPRARATTVRKTTKRISGRRRAAKRKAAKRK